MPKDIGKTSKERNRDAKNEPIKLNRPEFGWIQHWFLARRIAHAGKGEVLINGSQSFGLPL
jgi:hypothetical protein